MGQSTSRPLSAGLQPNRPTTNAVAGASSDLHPDSAENEESSRGGRRTSVRRSILNFVKPNGARSRVSSLGSSMGEGRRPWRNSRLWSRPPQDTANLGEPLTSSSSLTAGPSSASASQQDKGKQPEMVDSETEESQDRDLGDHQAGDRLSLSPSPDTLIQETLLDQTSTPSPISESHETPASLPLEPEPPSIETNPPATSPSPPPQLTPSPPTQPPARQFPPPGTLVVVQGIVHTTDVSRNPPEIPPSTSRQPTPTPGASELSLDPGTSRTRNRLSALLRPRSASSRPSSAVLNEPVPSLTVTPPPEQDQLSEFQSSEELTRPRSATPIVTEPAEAPPPLPEPPVDNRATSISSSSIDVLGTLLSVAAAATAASLLTGSSEPILSSGLAPPGSTTPAPPSPTHTTATNLSPPPPLADISAAGRAERMRQAWSTIRERLGLRPSAPSSTGDQTPGEPTSSPNPPESPATSASPTDTRELMLAEMARAFNIGLGLNGLAGTQTSGSAEAGSAPTPPTTTSGATSEVPPVEPAATDTPVPSPPLPPEGSFERFLVDLQIDLRTALTRSEEEQPVEDQAPASEEDGDATSEVTPLLVPAGAMTGDQGSDDAEHQVEVDQRRVNDDDANSMPDLQEVSDSESEFDDDEDLEDTDEGGDDAEEHEDFHSAFTSNHGAPNPNPADRHPNFGGRIDAFGRINWWRLYRFPPIMSPRVDLANLRQTLVPGGLPAAAAAAASPSSTTPLPAGTLPLPQPTTPLSDASSLSPSVITPSPDSSANVDRASPPETSIPSPTPAPAPATPHPLHAVVPVIVVGLQSVNQEWPSPSGDNEGIDIFGQPSTESASPTDTDPDDDFDGFGGQRQQGASANHPGLSTGENTRGRGRGWQHRAANAFRNLRPGRRQASAAQQPATPPGSRTFLIYVIGGYYPPDHSIVTGGPNNLDSFEALLELADLLGQVKPATVSKDEIEKSGLEIIKTEQLEQHEKDGKIASNCVDRCLICLDDYEPEQDLRVMSCKHAFHKACVDEWLQKGRNNCPACRTTGVNLDAPSTSVPAS